MSRRDSDGAVTGARRLPVASVDPAPAREETDNAQSKIKDGMLELASGNAVLVMTNCAAMEDRKGRRDLCVPVLRGETGGREVDVMRDIVSGYKGFF
ncbi:hypothetical protein PoB_006961800 [Plakobranchus ocellatus]|uniref:Uncharacterized protein n=1 Tax=Plakobranchus ocellatus TaxID=259542 RepID=A0AAV4DFP7_9GAST|nr:hypothetical protein PoB_006961800 [Plakobranchus ocellatus]